MKKHSLFFFAYLFITLIRCSFLTPLLYSQETQQLISYEKGKLTQYHWPSRILKNSRDVWIYTPPHYTTTQRPYPLLIVFDGQAYTSSLIPAPQILDDLINQKAIPPVVAIFISSIDQPSRNLELPCHAPFVAFLAQELLPWTRSHLHVSQNPSQVIIAGSSYGGLAAAYAALKHPELFGKVLSQSGAFWWKPVRSSSQSWLIQQFKAAPSLPIQFYLDVGDQETESSNGSPSMQQVNRQMVEVLKSKGNRVYYQEFKGGHEFKCWAKTFSQGLTILLNR